MRITSTTNLNCTSILNAIFRNLQVVSERMSQFLFGMCLRTQGLTALLQHDGHDFSGQWSAAAWQPAAVSSQPGRPSSRPYVGSRFGRRLRQKQS